MTEGLVCQYSPNEPISAAVPALSGGGSQPNVPSVTCLKILHFKIFFGTKMHFENFVVKQFILFY